MNLKPTRYDEPNRDLNGLKLLENDNVIGLHYYGSFCRRMSIFRSIEFNKHLSCRTILTILNLRKLTVKLYGYPSMFSYHKSEDYYGLHILFLGLWWYRH